MTWVPCLADKYLGVAFFDGIRIDTDRITDPRWDRVLPVLAEEQIFMCRVMEQRGLFARKPRVLDVGTGCGVFAIWAASRGCEVVGLDISPRAIRFAEHNHAANKEAIHASGGSITWRLEDIDNWSQTCHEEFDLVILAPPYNPTAPGILPALHAGAGPLGQKCFDAQIRIAPRLLNDYGMIVGNHMAVHRRGGASSWWADVLTNLPHSRARKWHVNYTPILDPSEISARAFLEEQYQHFLESNLALNPDADTVRKYIENSLGQENPEECRFGLYYFEIHSSDDATSTNQCELERSFIPPADWSTRIELHRQIVEHSSRENTMPTPALFLVNDFTPPLPPHPDPVKLSQAGAPEYSFDQSPLTSVLRWIIQSRLVDGISGCFDLLLVDIGPWFHHAEGREAIRQQAILCLGDERDPSSLLRAYQVNTSSQQQCSLGPFLHPYFTGASKPDIWRGVQHHVMSGDHDKSISDPAHKSLLDSWDDRVRRRFAQLEETANVTATSIPEDVAGARIKASFSSTFLKELDVSDVQRYTARTKKDYRIRRTEEIPDETIAKDLELIHIAFHRRLRSVLSQGSPQPSFTSALIGIPLSLAFSGRNTPPGELPSNYRGGIWIYASSIKAIGPKEESLLFDLARLASIIASADVTAASTAALSAVVEKKLQRFGTDDFRAWNNFADTMANCFASGAFHDHGVWLKNLKLADDSQPLAFRARVQSLKKAWEDLSAHLNGTPLEIPLEPMMLFGKAATRGYDWLPVALIAALIRVDGAKEDFNEFAFLCLKIENPSVSPLHLIRAFNIMGNSTNAIRVESKLTRNIEQRTVTFSATARYRTPQDASKSVSDLGKRPRDRMLSDTRNEPGEAARACNWLSGEAIDCQPTTTIANDSVERRWAFKCAFLS